jgi:hypothetical protein
MLGLLVLLGKQKSQKLKGAALYLCLRQMPSSYSSLIKVKIVIYFEYSSAQRQNN